MIMKNISIDFVERTLELIDNYNKEILCENNELDVTLYLNCLLGLIVLPRENLHSLLDEISNPLESDEIPLYYFKNSIKQGDVKKEIKEYILLIRNCISHVGQEKIQEPKSNYSRILTLNDIDNSIISDNKFNIELFNELDSNPQEGKINALILYNMYNGKENVIVFRIDNFKKFVVKIGKRYLEYKKSIK